MQAPLIQDETKYLKAFLGFRYEAFSKFRLLTRAITFDIEADPHTNDRVACPLIDSCRSWMRQFGPTEDVTDYQKISAASPLREARTTRIFLTILFFQLLKSRHAKKVEFVERDLLSFWRPFSGENTADLSSFFDFIANAVVVDLITQDEIEKRVATFKSILDQYIGLLYFPLQHIELEQQHTWIPKPEKFVTYSIDEWAIGQFAELRGIELKDYSAEHFLETQPTEVVTDFFKDTSPYSVIVPDELTKYFIEPWKEKLLSKISMTNSLQKDLRDINVRMFVLKDNKSISDVKSKKDLQLTKNQYQILNALQTGTLVSSESLKKLVGSSSIEALYSAISPFKKALFETFGSEIFQGEKGRGYSLHPGVRLYLD